MTVGFGLTAPLLSFACGSYAISGSYQSEGWSAIGLPLEITDAPATKPRSPKPSRPDCSILPVDRVFADSAQFPVEKETVVANTDKALKATDRCRPDSAARFQQQRRC